MEPSKKEPNENPVTGRESDLDTFVFQAEIRATHAGEAWEKIESQIQEAIDSGYSAAYPFELYKRLPSGEE